MQDSRKEIIPNTDEGFRKVESCDTLPQLAGGWAEREYLFGDYRLTLTLPNCPDILLDETSMRSANQQDDYMPYWAYLWPAAVAMSNQVSRAAWPRGTDVLELGCGVGLVGLAALANGCRVTMTDYDPRAIQVAGHNARRNGFVDFETQQLDWRHPLPRRYPIILGCDLLYEERNLEPILNLLDVMLDSGGECWLADGGRRHATHFLSLARDRGYNIHMFDANGTEVFRPGDQLQIFRMQKRSDPANDGQEHPGRSI
ncbi:MAG: class I SAM-dependent methyltransferase [Planctomycetota bacterium]